MTACGGANDTVCAPLTTCGPSEVVSVPATPTSDRQCEPAVAGLPPPVTLEEGVGLGFWLDPASQTALGVTERPVGGYVNGEPGSSGSGRSAHVRMEDASVVEGQGWARDGS